MKKTWGILMIVIFLSFCGCASIQSNMNYSSLAKEHEFDYFFPSYAFVKNFDNTEEAFDYVKTAQTKFTTSSGKSKAMGLAAKITGPEVSGEKPVLVVCNITATGTNARNEQNVVLDLSNEDRPLEEMIRVAISASVTFLVFYEDRGVSFPGYYLQSGYRYTSANSQIESFPYNNNIYTAEYPPNWSIEKAFSYLRKEIN